MANERKTEELVRQLLRDKSYYDAKNDVLVEEQSSDIEAVKTALKKASKTGGGGKGSPEFIISSPSTPDFVIVFECKADTKNHKSKNTDNPVGYAVDGVLHYSKYLSAEFNVISVVILP